MPDRKTNPCNLGSFEQDEQFVLGFDDEVLTKQIRSSFVQRQKTIIRHFLPMTECLCSTGIRILLAYSTIPEGCLRVAPILLSFASVVVVKVSV